MALLSRFSHARLCVTPETAAHQVRCPWDSPRKNTGMGCYFLLQCMKVKSESEVAQSCPTPRDPMDCSLPGSSVHGIFQARVLEWVAIAFSIAVPRAQLFSTGDSYIYTEGWCEILHRNSNSILRTPLRLQIIFISQFMLDSQIKWTYCHEKKFRISKIVY